MPPHDIITYPLSTCLQLERGYAVKDDASMTFMPSPLGEALIGAYRRMGLEGLWVPTLRGVIESNIAAVARGQRTKARLALPCPWPGLT